MSRRQERYKRKGKSFLTLFQKNVCDAMFLMSSFHPVHSHIPATCPWRYDDSACRQTHQGPHCLGEDCVHAWTPMHPSCSFPSQPFSPLSSPSNSFFHSLIRIHYFSRIDRLQIAHADRFRRVVVQSNSHDHRRTVCTPVKSEESMKCNAWTIIKCPELIPWLDLLRLSNSRSWSMDFLNGSFTIHFV